MPMPAATMTVTHEEGYVLSDDPARLDLAAIHEFLSTCYWSTGILKATVATALANSHCFGLYAPPDGAQVGLARFVTDRATFAYLCDVYVLEAHRGHGLGRWLIKNALSHPDFATLRRLVLVTRDAHELYRPYGFRELARPQGYMELHRPDVYRQAQAGAS